MPPHARVLVVLPMYGGSLPVGRYCVRALAELGHSVEVFEAPAFHGAFTALKGLRVTTDRLEYLENAFLQVVSQAVLAKVETFRPDLVLSMAQAPLSRQALRRLARDGVATAMWFVEDFRLFTYWRAFAPLYDVFAVIQKEPFLDELERAGVRNTLYLPLAADPEFHLPLDLGPVERRKYGSDVSFLGAGYANRRLAFRLLAHLDFAIWGSDWDGDDVLAQRVRRGGERIAPEEAVKIFNATAVNLNLHSSVRASPPVAPGDFVNPRTFELAMCGAFQLVDRRELLPELFADDELVTFTSMEELLERIEYFLARPEERAVWAAKARERALAEHTYVHRMTALIEFTASRLGSEAKPWPAPRGEASALAELPGDLGPEIARLLDDLGLPADAGFQDLVWAVRRRSGVLDDLETAVLFLDEWRKQYGITE